MCTGQSPLTLDVIEGIVGMTHHEKALDQLFIIASELPKLLHEFAAECVRQCQQRQNNTTPWHHKLSRMMNNPETSIQLQYVFRDPFVAAEDEEDIHNIVTMEVMTEQVSRDILK